MIVSWSIHLILSAVVHSVSYNSSTAPQKLIAKVMYSRRIYYWYPITATAEYFKGFFPD